MSILITGAEGFVGRNLAEMFVEKKYPVLFPKRNELDLLDDLAVGKYFASQKIDTIIHCATTERIGTIYPPNTCEWNLRMFFNLRKRMTPDMRMINLGSGSEYSRKFWHRKMPEEFFDVNVPEDPHSYAKYVISKYIQDVPDENLVCLRIFGIFGKYEDYRYKFISNSIVKNIFGMPIVINQNVNYDYLYITDFFRIVETMLKKWPKNRILNVTPNNSIDLVTVVDLINKIGRHKSEIQILHEGIGVEYSGDNRKLLGDIGSFSFTAPDESIAHLYQYFLGIRDSLDEEAVKRDAYLEYAKNLRTTYFGEKGEKPHH